MESGHRPIVFFIIFISALCFDPSSIYAAASTPKVSVALYYETLCPYCSNLIVNILPKIFSTGLISIVDLKLVPYGNARIGSDGSITCQHGQYECLLNTIEACAISTWPDVQEHFKLIYCIEKLVLEHKYGEWESCFQKTGFNSQPVVDCYNSGYGEKLELQYATETNALQPQHTYVPWVVVDGKPIYDDYRIVETYICEAYSGEPPKACEGLILASTEEMNVNHADHGCRVNEMIRSSAARKNNELKIEMLV